MLYFYYYYYYIYYIKGRGYDICIRLRYVPEPVDRR